MITELYVWMYHGCKIMPMEIGDGDVIDDIIKSKSIPQQLKMWWIGLIL